MKGQPRRPGEPVKVSSVLRAPAGAAARKPGAARKPAGAFSSRSRAAPAPEAAAAPLNEYALPEDREEAEKLLQAAIGDELRAAQQAEEIRDPLSWRDVRVYVSSTFEEMHGERDHLAKVVFPRLNAEWGRSHRTRFSSIDLRWGLPREDTSTAGRGAVLCCLDEIRRSRPWFLCLLGARYGWVPPGGYLPAAMTDGDLATYAWLRRWPPGDSLTELEAWYGLLGAPAGAALRAFAFLRDGAPAPSFPREGAGRGAPPAPDALGRQEALRARIAAHPLCAAAPYRPRPRPPGPGGGPPAAAALEDFGAAVFKALRGAAAADYDAARPRGADEGVGGALGPERAAQRLLAERLAAACVGREALVAAIADFAAGRPVAGGLLRPPPRDPRAREAGGGGVLLVTGRAGHGASSAVAKAALALAAERRPAVLHFVGRTEHPTDAEAIVRRLLAECAAAAAEGGGAGPGGELPSVAEAAEAVPGGVAILLAGVNAMEGPGWGTAAAAARELGGRLGGLRGGSRLVLSCVEGPHADELARALPCHRLAVPPADRELAGEIVRRGPAAAGGRLAGPQLAALLAKREAGSPLYLRLAGEELLALGGPERLDAELEALPGELPALLDRWLARLERDSPLAGPALALLAAAPAGISESDLLLAAALAAPALGPAPAGEPLPAARLAWSRLAAGFGPLLRPAGGPGGLLAFSHRHVLRAVRARYLAGCPHEACPAAEAGDTCAQARPAPDPAAAREPRAWEERWAARDGRLHQALAVTALCSASYRPHARLHLRMSAAWQRPTAAAPLLDAGLARLASLRALRLPLLTALEPAGPAEGPAAAAEAGLVRGLCGALAGAPRLRKVTLGAGDERGLPPESPGPLLPREAAASVAGLLRRAAGGIAVLDLAGLGIDAERLAAVAEAARGRPTLRGLGLARNRLYGDAGPVLEGLLAALPSLRRLDISSNALTPQGMEGVLRGVAGGALEVVYVDLRNVEPAGGGAAGDEALLRPLARWAAAAAAAAPALEVRLLASAAVFSAEGGPPREAPPAAGTTVAGVSFLIAAGGALTPLAASLDALRAGSAASEVLWVEEACAGAARLRWWEPAAWVGRLVEHVDPARGLEPSPGGELEPLLGVWEGEGGLELRLQSGYGRPEWGRLYVGSLREAGGLWVLKAPPRAPAATALAFAAQRLIAGDGGDARQRARVEVALREGGVELAWGPPAAPDSALARLRLARAAPPG